MHACGGVDVPGSASAVANGPSMIAGCSSMVSAVYMCLDLRRVVSALLQQGALHAENNWSHDWRTMGTCPGLLHVVQICQVVSMQWCTQPGDPHVPAVQQIPALW